MRKIIGCVLVLVIAAAVQISSASVAAGAAETTHQNFTVTGNGDLGDLRVVASGAINARGTDLALGDDEEPETGNLVLRDEFAFAGGSLLVTAAGPIDFGFNPRSCIRSNTFHGTYDITGKAGTAYEGAAGHGSYEGRLVFNERGPGGCSETGGHGHLIISYRGTIALPS